MEMITGRGEGREEKLYASLGGVPGRARPLKVGRVHDRVRKRRRDEKDVLEHLLARGRITLAGGRKASFIRPFAMVPNQGKKGEPVAGKQSGPGSMREITPPSGTKGRRQGTFKIRLVFKRCAVIRGSEITKIIVRSIRRRTAIRPVKHWGNRQGGEECLWCGGRRVGDNPSTGAKPGEGEHFAGLKGEEENWWSEQRQRIPRRRETKGAGPSSPTGAARKGGHFQEGMSAKTLDKTKRRGDSSSRDDQGSVKFIILQRGGGKGGGGEITTRPPPWHRESRGKTRFTGRTGGDGV